MNPPEKKMIFQIPQPMEFEYKTFSLGNKFSEEQAKASHETIDEYAERVMNAFARDGWQFAAVLNSGSLVFARPRMPGLIR